MAQNSIPSKSNHNEIELIVLIKTLRNSWKLIISSVLFFSLISYFFTLQDKDLINSGSLIEIGSILDKDSNQMLIESPESLIQNINIDLVYKLPELGLGNVQIDSLEEKLLNISSTSTSEEENINKINEVLSYIKNRHDNLFTEKTLGFKTRLNFIDGVLKEEIASTQLELKEISSIIFGERINLTNDTQASISIKEIQLSHLNNKILELEKTINEESLSHELLNKNKEMSILRSAQYPSLNQIISEYKINLLNTRKNKEILLLELDNLNNILKKLNDNELFVNFLAIETKKMKQRETFLKNKLSALLKSLPTDSMTLKTNELIKEKSKLLNVINKLSSEDNFTTKVFGPINSNQIAPKLRTNVLFGLLVGLLIGILIAVFYKSLKFD